MVRIGIKQWQLRWFARVGAVSVWMALAIGLTNDATADDALQFELKLDAPAAAAATDVGKKPAAPNLDVQFTAFEERLQTEPAPNVIRAAIDLLRTQPTEVPKEYSTLIESWHTDALTAEPKSLLLRLLYLELLDVQERQDDLIKYSRKLLKEEDIVGLQRGMVANNLAYALTTRGDKKDLPEAEAAMEEAIQAFGPTPDLLDTRAIVRLAKGDLQDAREDLQSAIEARPGSMFYFHLALLEEKAGNRDAVRAAMQQAIELKVERNQIPPPERKAFDRLLKDLDAKK